MVDLYSDMMTRQLIRTKRLEGEDVRVRVCVCVCACVHVRVCVYVCVPHSVFALDKEVKHILPDTVKVLVKELLHLQDEAMASITTIRTNIK